MANLKLNNVVALSETGGVATFGSPSATLVYPTGHVIETNFATNASSTSISSTTKGSGTEVLSITFDAASTSNYLYFMGNVSYYRSTASSGFGVEVHNGTSIIYTDAPVSAEFSGVSDHRSRFPFHFRVNPASTGSITYAVRVFKISGCTLTANFESNSSDIMCFEVQA